MGARTSRVVVFFCAIFVCSFFLIPQGWAQDDTSNDVALPKAQEDGALNCMESTCRSVPTREKIIALGTGYVRGLFGGMEQGAGINGGVQFTSKEIIPNLELRANLIGSSRLDRRVDFEALIPHVGSSRNHIDAWYSYLDRDTKYFGIGPRLGRATLTDFTVEQRSTQISFTRDLATHLQGGVYSQVIDVRATTGRRTRNPAIENFFSGNSDAPASEWAPGLFSTSLILSNGGYVLYDARNNLEGLTKGFYFLTRAATYDGFDRANAFSDYGWNEAEVDIRGYIPLKSPRTSLALRSRGQLKNPKGGSQIPFYDLSWVGGREYVRGYNSYRFRANNMLMYSAELRQTLIEKSPTRGIDAIAFADTGQVWGDARSLTDPAVLLNRHLDRSNWHSGVGFAVQYRHTPKLAARIDVSHSNEGYFVYMSVTRGF